MTHKTIRFPLHVTNGLVGERNITPNTQTLTNWDESWVERSAYDWRDNQGQHHIGSCWPFKKIRFYSEHTGKPLKILNRGAWNAVYIFNSSQWLLFRERIGMGQEQKWRVHCAGWEDAGGLNHGGSVVAEVNWCIWDAFGVRTDRMCRWFDGRLWTTRWMEPFIAQRGEAGFRDWWVLGGGGSRAQSGFFF